MTAYIRPLSSRDLDRCAALESAAFPPSQAATYEKVPRLPPNDAAMCQRLTSSQSRLVTDFQVLSSAQAASVNDGTLVAHTIATRAKSTLIVDQDMDYPKDWKANPRAVAGVGHQPSGTSVALHSLAVSPDHQRRGLGKLLMGKYIEQVKRIEGVERIAILTYDRLVPYYEKLGFKNHGKSAATYAGVSWYDLTYDFS
ncbi:acetyltransferase [Metarhizium album ARSEF 1941]|uniref:Acetyltransferase n=1 Tax=Metarhizium album (strain ARSEF 1941) TaxID=1081103 RepID=A0A0B2WMX0_METAS|nr:acetyltransferase [Metarhizium album ARSEF 1941]KHN95248.1 acetyltransferase [Metarhizium album ARSEF 1941]